MLFRVRNKRWIFHRPCHVRHKEGGSFNTRCTWNICTFNFLLNIIIRSIFICGCNALTFWGWYVRRKRSYCGIIVVNFSFLPHPQKNTFFSMGAWDFGSDENDTTYGPSWNGHDGTSSWSETKCPETALWESNTIEKIKKIDRIGMIKIWSRIIIIWSCLSRVVWEVSLDVHFGRECVVT